MEQFSSKEKFSSVVNERDMTIRIFFSLCLSYCHAYNSLRRKKIAT